MGSFVIETSDGNFIVCGATRSFGAGEADIWLLKVDENGDTLWTETFGGISTDEPEWIEETSDDGFIITGNTESYGEGKQDIWLIKTDVNGDTQWTKTYGGVEEEDIHNHGFVGKLEDGGYIVIGETKSFGPDNDIWILITDSLGDTISTRLWEREPSHNDRLCCANRSHDKFLIIEGSGTATTHVFIELNLDGNELWNGEYVSSVGNLPWEISFVSESYDGHIVTGSAYSVDPLVGPAIWTGVVTVSPFEVNELWSKTIDITGIGLCVQPTTDSGYIVVGDPLTFCKLNRASDTTWSRTYNGIPNYVIQTTDGGYLVTGSKDGNLWLLKTETNGDIQTVEEPVPVTHESESFVVTSIGRQITLRYASYPQGFHAEVFDAPGRKVDEIHSIHQSGTLSWGEHHGAGVYFIKPVAVTRTEKVIIVK